MGKDIDMKSSPMMSESGKNELYLYSLKKMAKENADKNMASLTNLYGLKAFFCMANELMNNNKDKTYALIRMDIYSFKTVNEFCGREAGDDMLRYISDCFRKYEKEDTVVGHLRADIFVMCVPFKDRQELIDITSEIKGKIDAYELSCKAFPAFGICIAKTNMDVSLMCDYADMALQKIKGKVFTYYAFYDDNMRKELMYERRIENEIEDALRTGCLKVYIQPKVDMRDGGIVGGEALIRWIHPTEGFIYPDKFIPILEKSGHIVDVDTFVWHNVIRRIGDRIKNGKRIVPISLNVSRVHVYHTNFSEILENFIREYDISAGYVPLEVTESIFIDDEMNFYDKVTQLQNRGFKFVMDDFGAGYSSLNMLKTEPVDEVKIDRLFLNDIENRKSKVVIRNIINMINELGLDMIAEGVETEEQAELLKSYGCNKAQGFLYYRPMPMEEFEQLLDSGM